MSKIPKTPAKTARFTPLAKKTRDERDRRSDQRAERNLRAELEEAKKELEEAKVKAKKEREEKKTLAMAVGNKDKELGDLRARQGNNSDLECPICYELFSRQLVPHVIECGHTICSNCIRQLAAGTRDQFNCPLCRTPSLHRTPFPANIALFSIITSSPPASSPP